MCVIEGKVLLEGFNTLLTISHLFDFMHNPIGPRSFSLHLKSNYLKLS